MKLKEIIVVEGKDDTVAIQRAVRADTIETNGSAARFIATIEQIKLAAQTRGVIFLTDPDYPGEKIRKKLQNMFRIASTPFYRGIWRNTKTIKELG